jgi:alkylation response protein AidB-like acyl-CoA dehydrogenase
MKSPFLTHEHEMIRQTIREFAEKEISPLVYQLDKNEEFSVELVKRMGEMGLFGMCIPVEYGGQGLDYLSFIIAIEEIARVDSSQAGTLSVHNSLGIGPIFHHGTKEQKEKYLPDLCSGNHIWAFALTEPNSGSDSRSSNTRAVLNNDTWKINGSKTFITNGNTAITRGVTLQTVTGSNKGKKEFSTILVEKGAEGFTAETIHDKMVWRGTNTSQLFFNDCSVPKQNILGPKGNGSKIMLRSLDSGKLGVAAIGVGLAQGAYEMALKYAKNRKQFGKSISNHQAIAFKLADMHMKIELARTMLYKACWLKDNNQRFSIEATISKLYSSEVAKEVADESVQIHGGYGLIKEYPIERFFRDQRMLQIGEGTSEIQRIIISKYIGCYSK